MKIKISLCLETARTALEMTAMEIETFSDVNMAGDESFIAGLRAGTAAVARLLRYHAGGRENLDRLLRD